MAPHSSTLAWEIPREEPGKTPPTPNLPGASGLGQGEHGVYFLYQFLWATFLLPCICVTSEKAMAPHSRTLAWKIPWMEEPGTL